MTDILGFFTESGNSSSILFLLVLAIFRVYLEVIRFDFSKLPITGHLSERFGEEYAVRIHKWGLFFSVGYIVLFAPTLLYA